MTPLQIVLLIFLVVVATLASYIQRIYSEFGKILSRDVQENLDAWEQHIEPRLGLSRDHAALCSSVLKQIALGLITLEFGELLFVRPAHMGPPNAAEIAQAILAVVLVVIFCYQLIPDLLFNRTRGLCPLLVEHVTAERVSRLFAPLIIQPVQRYCVPALAALNFVLHRPRTESITRSLALDAHGKSLSFVLLNLDIDLAPPPS